MNSQKCDQGNSSRFKPEQHIRGLFDDPRLLQQVLGYLGPDDRSGGCEFHLQVLAKAAGVVVYCCAGVSEGLDKRVDLQDLLTQCAIVGLRAANMFHFKKAEIFKVQSTSMDTFEKKQMTTLLLYLSQEGKMLNNQVGTLCFPCTALPADYNTLRQRKTNLVAKILRKEYLHCIL